MKRSVFIILMVIFGLMNVPCGLAGDVPDTMNYQGRLTDNTGAGISGSRSVTFSLYDVPSGGTALWNENQTVTLSDGRFSVVLGNSTPLDSVDFTGETYIGIQVETDPEMTPRQRFTSVPYALKSGNAVPAGVIVMWSGETVDIPDGWALCDGVERTLPDGSTKTPPDLRDRFIVGGGNAYSVGDRDGEAEHTLTIDEMPSHNHSVDPPSTQTNSDTHSHSISFNSDGSNDPLGGNRAFCTDNRDTEGPHTSNSMSAISDTHSHYVNIAAFNSGTKGGGQPHNNLPPYHALCFIMKLY